MTLTLGEAPLGQNPPGIFNREIEREGILYLHPFLRRVRGIAADETVVDSRAVQMLHEYGRLPIFLFPRDDVRTELLEPSEKQSEWPNKGPATWWHLRVDGEVREDAAWEWSEPPVDAPPLAGLIGFKWDALDKWMEEDEENVVHARDPFHRVDTLETSRQVRISLDDVVLAETTRGKVIFETGLPPRWYVPLEDVNEEALVPSEFTSGCAYKGFADYWTVRVGDREETDVAWRYREPLHDAAPVAGMVAFFNERVDIDLDGKRQERPFTPWHPDWKGESEAEAGPPVVQA